MGSLLKTLGVNSSAINLLRNTSVYDRDTTASGSVAEARLHNWVATFGGAVSGDFYANHRNRVYIPIADVGPDATRGSVYSDSADPARKFLVTKPKVSGDGESVLIAIQTAGSKFTSAPTGVLSKDSGTGDATISWTLTPYYAIDNFLGSVLGPDYSDSGLFFSCLSAVPDSGWLYPLRLSGEDYLGEGVLVTCAAEIYLGTSFGGTRADVELVDQNGIVLAAGSTTSAATSDFEIIPLIAVAIPPGTTSLDLRLRAVGGTNSKFGHRNPIVNVGPTVSPYAPRRLGPWITLRPNSSFLDGAPTGDFGPALIDLSDQLPANAVEVKIITAANEVSPVGQSTYQFYSHGISSLASDLSVGNNGTEGFVRHQSTVLLDDQQRFGYSVAEGDANSNVSIFGNVVSYRGWEGSIG